MATISRVFSIEFNGKRELLLVYTDQSCLNVLNNLTTEVSLHSVSCSANACDWTSLTSDIMSLPVIQVMESFSFKFIRIEMTPRKRRLQDKKINRYAWCLNLFLCFFMAVYIATNISANPAKPSIPKIKAGLAKFEAVNGCRGSSRYSIVG